MWLIMVPFMGHLEDHVCQSALEVGIISMLLEGNSFIKATILAARGRALKCVSSIVTKQTCRRGQVTSSFMPVW